MCFMGRWAGQPEWSHFLNSKGLLHEVEEAVLPITAGQRSCVTIIHHGIVLLLQPACCPAHEHPTWHCAAV